MPYLKRGCGMWYLKRVFGLQRGVLVLKEGL